VEGASLIRIEGLEDVRLLKEVPTSHYAFSFSFSSLLFCGGKNVRTAMKEFSFWWVGAVGWDRLIKAISVDGKDDDD
jgi:hypothetical protein